MDALIFLGFILSIFGAGWGIKFLAHQEREYKKRTWPTLALSNHLNFIPDSFLGKSAHVVGNYRGHHLMLDTIPKGQSDKPCTRLIMAMSSNYALQDSKKQVLTEQILGGSTANLRTSTNLSYPLKGQIKIESNGQELHYTQLGTENDIKYLQFLFDLLSDLIEAYPHIIALGGEVVHPLQVAATQRGNLRPLLHQLLEDIAHDTTMRLGNQASHLLCPHCLTCYGAHKIPLSWPTSLTYYGCRVCGQSREFFKGWVIAVLDVNTVTEQTRNDSILRVNWLIRRALFDFDEVEIRQATDEAVERFAMNIGNDTDLVRKSRYKQMRCRVLSNCEISENAVRILQRTFGQVKLEGLAHR